MNFEVLPARSTDEGLLRRWLPQAFVGQPRPAFFVAVEGEGGPPVGAGSLRTLGTFRGLTEDRFLVFVRPESRRRGAGAAIMRRLIDEARRHQVDRLLAGRSPADDGENAFYESLGLTPLRQIGRYAIDVGDMPENFQRIYRRLEQQQSWPENTQPLSLHDFAAANIARFAASTLGGFSESFLSGFSDQASVVIAVEGRIAGLLLARVDGFVAEVDVIAVAPEYRGGWINMLLRFESRRRLLAMGIEKVYFEADLEDNAATTRLAARRQAAVLEVRRLYGINLKS